MQVKLGACPATMSSPGSITRTRWPAHCTFTLLPIQPGGAAVDLLREYRVYCKNELQASVKSAELRIAVFSGSIGNLNCAFR
jgi:hypothetical protein